MRISIVTLLILFTSGCSKSPDYSKYTVTPNYMGDVDSLAELVMQGDSDAFDKLEIGTMNDLTGAAILRYAFTMANKYHYSKAYYYVYLHLCKSESCLSRDSINKLTPETKRLALEYLKKGMEVGEYNSVRDWNDLVENKLIDPNDYK